MYFKCHRTFSRDSDITINVQFLLLNRKRTIALVLKRKDQLLALPSIYQILKDAVLLKSLIGFHDRFHDNFPLCKISKKLFSKEMNLDGAEETN